MPAPKDTEGDDDGHSRFLSNPPTQDGGGKEGNENIIFDNGRRPRCFSFGTPCGRRRTTLSSASQASIKTKSTATDAQGKPEIKIEDFVQSWKVVRVENGDVDSDMTAGMPRIGRKKLRTQTSKNVTYSPKLKT